MVVASPWRSGYASDVDRDRLFLATLGFIETAVTRMPPDEHELLLLSGRLRMLLMDDEPLLDTVNRGRGFKLRFRILRHDYSQIPVPGWLLWATPDGLSPDLAPRGHKIPIELVSRTVFMHETVMNYKGEDVTVYDLIHHTANMAGGVHAGSSGTDKARLLDELAEGIALQGVPAGTRCLRGIAAVVLATARPLRDAILAGD